MTSFGHAKRKYFEAHHLCYMCGEPADPGYKSCLSCRMELRSHKRTRGTEAIFRRDEYHRMKSDICYALGVCVSCMKRDALPGLHICNECRLKMNERHRRLRESKPDYVPRYMFDGVSRCAMCGKIKEDNGHKFCNACYAKVRKSMLYARSCRKGRNYFERVIDAQQREYNWRRSHKEGHDQQTTEKHGDISQI